VANGGIDRRQFFINSFSASLDLPKKNARALPSSQNYTFRLYPYGSVQFTDRRVSSPLSFAHVTDLHLTPYPAAQYPNPYRHAIEWWDLTFNRPHQVFPALLRDISAAGVDFVFFGGDNIDCYEPRIAQLIVNMANEYGLKVFLQSGNHDWEPMDMRYIHHMGIYNPALRTTTLRELCRYWNMPAPYYSFELKGVRFIALDCPYMKGNNVYAGFFDEEQTDWFTDQLRYTGPIVVFSHIPFDRPTVEYRRNKVLGQGGCVADDLNGRRILRAIEGCPNVLGTFTGHFHFRSEDEVGQSCQFMTAPASDGQWRYVKISRDPAPRSLRAAGAAEVFVER